MASVLLTTMLHDSISVGMLLIAAHCRAGDAVAAKGCYPLSLPFCFCVSVSLCFSPAVTDLTQLQLKQKKNEVDVQKEAQQPSALMSPPLQLEHQKSLAASPGSAHIHQLL